MSEDYKSLEHTIRNIATRVEESTSENKSLEHTIREIREGAISIGKKTSKFSELTNGKSYGDRTQPITQHAVQPKQPKGNDALEKAKEAIASHDWAGDIKSSLEKIAKDKEEFAKSGKKLMIHREESSFADRTTKPIDEKKKKVDEEEPRLNSEMNVNVSGHGKFTGSEFSNIPVKGHMGHVTPHSHSDKAETAGMARKMAKEKLGKNRVAEETQQLDEILPFLGAAAATAAPELTTAGLAALAGLTGIGLAKSIKGKSSSSYDPETAKKNDSYLSAASRMKQMKQMDIAPDVTKKQPETAPPKQEIKTGGKPEIYTPGKQTLPPIEIMGKPTKAPIATPAKAEAPPILTGKEKVATPPAVAQPTTGAATAGATTGVKAPAIADTSAVTAARQAANADTAAQSGAKTQTQTQAKTAVDTMAEPPLKNRGIPGLGGMTATSLDYLGKGQMPHEKGKASIAKKHRMHENADGGVERKKIQNVPRPNAGDRHKIAFVGRKDDDPKTAKEKTSRQAAYKINVIDEGKKLAGIIKGVVKDSKEPKDRYEPGATNGKTIVYPQVIINPDLKHNTMDADSDKMPNDHK